MKGSKIWLLVIVQLESPTKVYNISAHIVKETLVMGDD